jgi:Protein of unknown function (DUF4242)
MFYAAKCYWPGVTEADVRRAAARVNREGRSAAVPASGATYVGSLLFPDDALLLCLFEAASPSAVRNVSRRAGIPCERVMGSLWLARAESQRRLES